MPTRLIREGILTSDRVNALDDYQENFYRRLLNVVDDYGRFVAKPALLRSSCYPLRLESVTESNIQEHLAACAHAGLLHLYKGDDCKDYLVVTEFRQPRRAKYSKFPAPPGITDEADQVPAPPPRKAQPEPRPPPPPKPEPKPLGVRQPKAVLVVPIAQLVADGLDPDMAAEWLAHRKARKALLTHTAWNAIKKEAAKAGWSVADACTKAMERGWTAFNADWLAHATPRSRATGETAYHRERRERAERFLMPRPPTTLVQEVTDAVRKID